MTELVKFSFTAILIYLIIIAFRAVKARFLYDIEKKKITKNYDCDYSGVKHSVMRGHFQIPWPITDNDPKMTQYVTKYNILTKIFWGSYLIGIPVLVYLADKINKL